MYPANENSCTSLHLVSIRSIYAFGPMLLDLIQNIFLCSKKMKVQNESASHCTIRMYVAAVLHACLRLLKLNVHESITLLVTNLLVIAG